MRYISLSETRDFQKRAEPFLMQREVEHNLILGLCVQLQGIYHPYEEQPFHCIIETKTGALAGVAIRTPPYPLILSHLTDMAAIPFIVEACREADQDLTGVLAKPAVALSFAEEWQEQSGKNFNLSMRQMLHQLDEVIPARPVLGKYRIANVEDYELLEHWYVAFQLEVFGREAGKWLDDRARNAWQERLSDTVPQHFLWSDSLRPVCWVGCRYTTDRVARIAPVYTPPSERGRGYASALVASVSQWLLDQGMMHCSLYTDLANPTSNAVYQSVGYEPICEIHRYEFVDH